MPSGQLLELNAILAARNQSPSTYFGGAGYKDCNSLRNSGVAISTILVANKIKQLKATILRLFSNYRSSKSRDKVQEKNLNFTYVMVRDSLGPSDALPPQHSGSGSCSNASIKMPPGAVRPILKSLHGLLTLATVDLDPTTDFIAGTIAGRKSAIIDLMITIRFNNLSTPGIAGLLIAHPFDTGMLVPYYCHGIT